MDDGDGIKRDTCRDRLGKEGVDDPEECRVEGGTITGGGKLGSEHMGDILAFIMYDLDGSMRSITGVWHEFGMENKGSDRKAIEEDEDQKNEVGFPCESVRSQSM